MLSLFPWYIYSVSTNLRSSLASSVYPASSLKKTRKNLNFLSILLNPPGHDGLECRIEGVYRELMLLYTNDVVCVSDLALPPRLEAGSQPSPTRRCRIRLRGPPWSQVSITGGPNGPNAEGVLIRKQQKREEKGVVVFQGVEATPGRRRFDDLHQDGIESLRRHTASVQW
jgi:hypothetical protein